MKKKKITITLIFIISILLPFNVDAQRGCCSWHGGVSHCNTKKGRIVCNDGTYSPSCRCKKIAKKKSTKKKQSSKKSKKKVTKKSTKKTHSSKKTNKRKR